MAYMTSRPLLSFSKHHRGVTSRNGKADRFADTTSGARHHGDLML
jgi:hypothetical protein